jgi:hypothetical protein
MAIVKRLWTAREAALTAFDPALVAQVETASAQQEDAAYIAAVRCGCEPRKFAHPLLQVVPQVPTASVTPAFFAEVRTSNGKTRPWYVIAVAQDHGGWKIAHLTFGGSAGTPPLHAVTASNGVTPGVTAAGRKRMQRLAQTAFRHAATHVAKVSHTSYGATVRTRPALNTARDGIYGLSLPGGKVLSCFTAHQVETYTIPGGVLRQNPSRSNWDQSIAPGDYSSIILDKAVPLCVVGSGIGSDPGVARWTYDERTFGAGASRA